MEVMELSFKDFYQGKKVLVTGHTGFKGSWLSLWLRELGAELSGYSLPTPTDPSLYSILNLDFPETLADINDQAALVKHLQTHQPEIIFHLAAQPLVRESYRNPIGTFQTNIAGIWNLLAAVEQVPSVRAIIVVTTDKCYQNHDLDQSFSETDPLGGHDPYSASKACVEIICESWRSSFLSSPSKPVLATVRAGNVIGGGDWAADRLLSDCIRSFVAGKQIELRYPQAIRPWQHVLSALSGYLLLAEKLYTLGGHYAEAWNFGPRPDDRMTVEELVKMSAELWGVPDLVTTFNSNNLHESRLLSLNIDKAVTRLNWSPNWDVQSSLIETINWYKSWHQGVDMLNYSIKQINKYQSS